MSDLESQLVRVTIGCVLGLAFLACAPHPESERPASTAPMVQAESSVSDAPEPVSESGSPAAEEVSATSTPEARERRDLPSECDKERSQCFMPGGFVEQLCRGKYGDAALALFSAKMPWQRAYVKAKVIEPVNTFGGEQSERWMEFGEEVLVMRRREVASSSGVQVSGPQDVDVLRWDGTCATVRQEMLVSYVPGKSHRRPAPWRYLEEGTREALLEHRAVSKASEAAKSVCKGISVPERESRCERAQAQLTDAIAQALSSGVELPAPTKVPAWSE